MKVDLDFLTRTGYNEYVIFTPKQVESLNEYQKKGYMHPFTCGSGRRCDKDHLDGEGILVATEDGWICPFCDYTQNWAHGFMMDWSWKDHSPFNVIQSISSTESEWDRWTIGGIPADSPNPPPKEKK